MRRLTDLIKRLRPKRVVPKSKRFLALAIGIFTLVGILGGALAVRHQSSAAVSRDCSDNSINNQNVNGGCGAADPAEFIADLRTNNPSDLQTIFADSRIGLPQGLYNDFAQHAQEGVVTRSGDLIVNGQTVMTGVFTMGRTTLGGKQPTPIVIGGKTYFHSAPSASFGAGVESIPTMVLFDSQGTVQAAVMNPCGNPVTQGNKVQSTAKCKMLNMTPVNGKANTFSFTTDVTVTGLAKVVKVDYFVDEGNGPVLFATETNPATPVTRTFTKNATVTARLTASVPGNNQIVDDGPECTKQVTVEQKPTPTPTPTPTPKPVTPVPAPVTPAAPLPSTGPGDALGIFAGASAAGTLGHHLLVRRKKRK